MKLNHIAVLDIGALISAKNRPSFEKIRRSIVFYDFIKYDIADILPSLCFHQVSFSTKGLVIPKNIIPLFSSLDVNCPLYKLDKAEVSFPDTLHANFAFKSQFLRLWNSFDITLFVSVNGWMVLFFSKEVADNTNPIKILQTQLRFQESFDVLSSVNWGKAAMDSGAYDKLPHLKEWFKWLGITSIQSYIPYIKISHLMVREAIKPFVATLSEENLFPMKIPSLKNLELYIECQVVN